MILYQKPNVGKSLNGQSQWNTRFKNWGTSVTHCDHWPQFKLNVFGLFLFRGANGKWLPKHLSFVHFHNLSQKTLLPHFSTTCQHFNVYVYEMQTRFASYIHAM